MVTSNFALPMSVAIAALVSVTQITANEMHGSHKGHKSFPGHREAGMIGKVIVK